LTRELVEIKTRRVSPRARFDDMVDIFLAHAQFLILIVRGNWAAGRGAGKWDSTPRKKSLPRRVARVGDPDRIGREGR
jgi:hypothetical protein